MAVLFVGLLSASTSVQAAGLTLKPAQAALSVVAGQTTSQPFTVRNDGEQSVTVNVNLFDEEPTPTGAVGQLLPAASLPTSLAPFISYDPRILTIPPNTERSILLQVRPSAGIQPGRYIGVLTVGEGAPSNPIGADAAISSLAVTGQVGAIIGVTVTPARAPLTPAARLIQSAERLPLGPSLSILAVLLVCLLLVLRRSR